MKRQNDKGGKTQNTSTTEKQSEEAEAPQRFHNHLVTTENLTSLQSGIGKKRKGTLHNDNWKGTQPVVTSSDVPSSPSSQTKKTQTHLLVFSNRI